MNFPARKASPTISGTTTFCFIGTTPNRITGLSSYTDSIVSAYARRYPDQKLLFVTNADKEIFPSILKNPSIEIISIFSINIFPFKIYNIVAHLIANIISYKEKSDIYISTTPQGSILPITAQAFVIHDMYDVDPKFRSRFHVAYTNIMLRLYSFVSRDIICVSESTRNDALPVLVRSAAKLSVIKEASKYEPVAPEVALEEKRNGRILYVANIETTKNVDCLLEALRRAENREINLHVDWIGRDPKGLIQKWIEQNGPLNNFHPVGVVDDATLAKAYKHSNALVVTSFREGFCLPVLEANAHGTPAIVSDIPTLREIAGTAGAFFDPHQPEECLTRMREFVDTSPTETRLKRIRALENARRYSWNDAAGDFGKLAERNSSNTRR